MNGQKIGVREVVSIGLGAPRRTGFQITVSRTRCECASLMGKLTEGRSGLLNIIDVGRDYEFE